MLVVVAALNQKQMVMSTVKIQWLRWFDLKTDVVFASKKHP
jgi:hypothetical protein